MLHVPLEYDVPVKLSQLVTRVLANNSSFMTGAGTNTYLVGRKEIAVIDPGPGQKYHVRSIMESLEPGSKIKWILVSHSHPDHFPAARMLQEKTDAPILFQNNPGETYHNERLKTNEFSIQVIHTPGHTSNHLCFLLEDENLLFSGDHIMQGSTVVIIPPSGHMRSYLDSLESLKSYNIDNIAPGHGHIIETPVAEIDDIIEHRLEREAKVLSALKKEGGAASINKILPDVYDDVPFFKHGVAAFSLEAHLIKLEEDGIVKNEGRLWRIQ